MQRLLIALLAGVLLLLAAAGSFAFLNLRPDPARPDPGYGDFRITDFELIDQHGQPIDESILDGRFTVLDFFFTSCPIYCPAMGQTMRRVQDATAGTNARLLSISVDGANDAPEIIDAYAESLGADPDRWLFVTGDPAEVRRLAEAQLRLGIITDPTRQVTAPDGSQMDFIDHPTRLVLIGPDRRVLGMYSYAIDHEVDLLIERLRRIDP